MARKKDTTYLVHGVDCQALGSRYASMLLGDSKAQLVDLPELERHPVYLKLEDHQQVEVLANIKFAARDMLTMAGNSPTMVEKVISDK